jgi:hypothetical protein
MKSVDDIKALHADAAKLLLQQKPDEEIIAFIISKGHESHYARDVLENVRVDAIEKKQFRKTLFYGSGFIVAGLLAIFASWFFAERMGMLFYFFYWGLVVTGISIIIRAYIIFKN